MTSASFCDSSPTVQSWVQSTEYGRPKSLPFSLQKSVIRTMKLWILPYDLTWMGGGGGGGGLANPSLPVITYSSGYR